MFEDKNKGDGKARARIMLGIGMAVTLLVVLAIGLQGNERVPLIGVLIAVLGMFTVAMAFLKKS